VIENPPGWGVGGGNHDDSYVEEGERGLRLINYRGARIFSAGPWGLQLTLFY
jgi:hypothetical protein